MPPETAYRPDLPDFGAYLHWPSSGVSWIHPHDISVALQMIPSRRVFRRVRYDDTYYHLEYGRKRIRVRPTMWNRLPDCPFLVGEQVELLSDFGREEAGIARIVNIFANRSVDGFEYQLARHQMTLPRLFESRHFRAIHTRHHLRAATYQHQPARCTPPADFEYLNVGQLD